ncbi:conserved Plasmodium protein, unknown function [Plasmodium malariae]|uniref:Uncharacterized protein n=1 Tax=Plasmodium malariae TaxID=5858 RepID=A0A1A8X2T7_PLAMA|nr:conserved Plasmodium protein, unknown function [Plasmodium malariae]
MEKDFNLIEKNNLDEETNNLKDENSKYMESHPELKDLLNDFISSILLHTPVITINIKQIKVVFIQEKNDRIFKEDIFKYANEYFSYFKKK